MPIPQPFYVEWSPSTAPLDTPSWETLGRVATLTIDRDDSGKPGTMSCTVRNGNHAGVDAVHQFADWRRWTQVRVLMDVDLGDGPQPWFTGYLSKLEHDTSTLPFAATVAIQAVDGLGVWNRDTVARDTTDIPDGFLGFATTMAALATEIDTVSTGLSGVSADPLGNARAPVALPAEFVDDDDNVRHARFKANAIDALKKAGDVEAGGVHIGSDGTFCVNGRYAIPDFHATLDDPVLTFTDDLAEVDLISASAIGYTRGSLKFADPIIEYRNRASTTGLRKLEHTAGTVEAGDPVDAVEFSDLWCQDENWVDANAEFYAAMLAGYKQPWPTEISFVAWDTAKVQDTIYPVRLIVGELRIFGRRWVSVKATLPGASPEVWPCTISGFKLIVTASQAVVTLKLGPDHARWAMAYGDGITAGVPSLPTIVALDFSGRGLDSGAILGP